MKIIKLTAENVKRLRAVEITPAGDVVTITGRNAQGKTSVLDAIWLALGGGTAGRETARPIRDGETKASVTLDLGDLVVSRTWTGDKTALTVKNADGAKYSSPQRMLDELVGRLSFDPLEFTRLSAREQVAALLDLVELDVDLDALAAERQRLYDERTDIGRQGKALGDVPAVDDSLPESETSGAAILSELRAAEDHNRDLLAAQTSSDMLKDRIAELQREIATAKASLAAAERKLTERPENVAEIEARLDAVETTNAKIRANNAARTLAARSEELRTEYRQLTERIDSLDSRKLAAIKAATFPVDGLGFDDTGVTYNGVPFSQASSAEQIRVSLAMAMGLNPKLRVIRILDGSLLDDDNLALIADAAATHDYQVWIERVSDQTESAVVIEDGSVITP